MDFGARSMVAEAMKIAGRVGSIFLRDRNYPALRRTLPRPPISDGLDLQKLLDSRTPEGYLSRLDTTPFLDYDLKSNYAVEPLAHWAVGVPEGEGYVRVTSPLRRFTDIQNHYQILAALRGEKPVYSKDDLLTKAEQFAINDRWAKRNEGRSRLIWQIMFFEQWQKTRKEGEYDPLANLEAVLMDVPARHPRKPSFICPAIIPELGLRVTVFNLRSLNHAKFGQKVKVNNLRLQKGYHPSVWMDIAE